MKSAVGTLSATTRAAASRPGMTAARQAPTATTAVAPKNVTPRIPIHGAIAQSTPADTPTDRDHAQRTRLGREQQGQPGDADDQQDDGSEERHERHVGVAVRAVGVEPLRRGRHDEHPDDEEAETGERHQPPPVDDPIGIDELGMEVGVERAAHDVEPVTDRRWPLGQELLELLAVPFAPADADKAAASRSRCPPSEPCQPRLDE